MLLFRHLIALVVDLAVDEAADLVGDVLLRLLGQGLIHGVGLLHLGLDACLVDAQDPGKAPGDVGLVPDLGSDVDLALLGGLGLGLLDGGDLVVHVVLDLLGGDIHRLRCCGDGQDMLVAVIDGATGGSDHGGAGLLVHGLGLELLPAVHLEVVEADKENDKDKDAQKQHHQHGAPVNGLVCPAGGIAFSFGIGGHSASLLGDNWVILDSGPPGCAAAKRDLTDETREQEARSYSPLSEPIYGGGQSKYSITA